MRQPDRRSERILSKPAAGCVLFLFLFSACGGDGPDSWDDEARRAFEADVAAPWEVTEFTVVARAFDGETGAHRIKFQSSISLEEDLYTLVREDRGRPIVRALLKSGASRRIYGVARVFPPDSEDGPRVELDTLPVPRGFAASQLPERAVVAGTPEEREWLLELEKERARRLEERLKLQHEAKLLDLARWSRGASRAGGSGSGSSAGATDAR